MKRLQWTELVVVAVLALPPAACTKSEEKKRSGTKAGSGTGADGEEKKKSRRPERKCFPPPPEAAVPPPPNLPNVKKILPAWARTLKVLRPLKVRRKPSAQAVMEGEIKRYSRVPPMAYVSGRDGCGKYWMRVNPRGWVCGDYLEPDRRGVLLKPQPLMDPGRMLPGRYAWVRKGGAKKYPNRTAAEKDQPAGTIESGFIVRWKKTVEIAGRPFWQISTNFVVPAGRLLRHRPSRYRGADLRKLDMMLPVAIVRAKTRGAAVYNDPDGRIVGHVKHHSFHEIFETKRVGRTKYYRIGKRRWILARRVISAWPAPGPPPGLKPCEKWVEISVYYQSLVAFEGTEPVYATMVSTGKKTHPTKFGIFRMWWKKAETQMTSAMAGSERYRVDDVPWVQYFYLGQAVHGAYWHSEWGNRRSHGCINISPRDAKWLYDWTLPHVPDGWTSRRADEHFPGTLIRLKYKVDHEVMFKRYARKLAPPEAVKRLDKAYKGRMHKKYLRELEHEK